MSIKLGDIKKFFLENYCPDICHIFQWIFFYTSLRKTGSSWEEMSIPNLSVPLLYLKQGIGSVYVMVDFICKDYLELSGTRFEYELQNEKFLPAIGFEPGTFRLRSESATTEPRGQMTIGWIKINLVLTVLFLETYLQHMVNVAK